MTDLQRILNAIDDLNEVKDGIIESKKLTDKLSNVTLTYIRFQTGQWAGVKKWSTWKILLDQSKSQYAIRDRRGFTSKSKNVTDTQVIIAPATVKDMLLSVNKADWPMADAVLERLVNAKYKK